MNAIRVKSAKLSKRLNSDSLAYIRFFEFGRGSNYEDSLPSPSLYHWLLVMLQSRVNKAENSTKPNTKKYSETAPILLTFWVFIYYWKSEIFWLRHITTYI